MKIGKSLVIAAVALLILTNVALAGKSYKTKVTSVFVRSDGKALVTLERPATKHPKCQSYDQGIFAFNLNTDGGKGVYKALLYSKDRNLTVDVHGSNTCDTFEGKYAEDINWVRVPAKP